MAANPSPRRLLMVLPSLAGGGAERVAVTLLRGLPRERFEPTLALFHREGPYLEEVPADVPTVDLGGGGSEFGAIARLSRLIERTRPHVALSFLRRANLDTLLAARLHPGTPVVVSERNGLAAEFALYGGARLKRAAVRGLYPRAASIIANSAGLAAELTDEIGLPGRLVEVIPNPIDLARVRALAQNLPAHPWFAEQAPIVLAAGRLHPQKGFDLLIRAFARLRAPCGARLVILGEGPERRALERLIAELGLGNRVALPGFDANPYPYMARATVFALSSHFEALGNVLVEAGPGNRWSRNAPPPPREIIAMRDGLLVPAVRSLPVRH
jgi:glycosyltransferase involved in cell wall biosynthesis